MQNARKWMEKNKHIMFAMVLIHLYHMICLQEICAIPATNFMKRKSQGAFGICFVYEHSRQNYA